MRYAVRAPTILRASTAFASRKHEGNPAAPPIRICDSRVWHDPLGRKVQQLHVSSGACGVLFTWDVYATLHKSLCARRWQPLTPIPCQDRRRLRYMVLEQSGGDVPDVHLRKYPLSSIGVHRLDTCSVRLQGNLHVSSAWTCA